MEEIGKNIKVNQYVEFRKEHFGILQAWVQEILDNGDLKVYWEYEPTGVDAVEIIKPEQVI